MLYWPGGLGVYHECVLAMSTSRGAVANSVVYWLSRTLVGMGAVAVPACHRQGPMLQPWADPVRLPVSWDSGEDLYCDHRLDATSVM